MSNTTSDPTPGWASSTGLVEPGARGALPAPDDREAVLECIHRYAWAYDERNPAALRDVFTDDAVWAGNIAGTVLDPVVGRERITSWLEDVMTTQPDQRRHLVLNPVVQCLDGDEATVVAYLAVLSASGGGVTVATSGIYRVRLRREPDVWRMTEMIAGFDVGF